MEIRANLQHSQKRLEIHWVSLFPIFFRRVFRSICVGFFPLEKSPGGFCFQATFRVRFPKPPWNLFCIKNFPVLDYCESVSITVSGDTNLGLLTIHNVLHFTGIDPGVCLWVGPGVWKFQKPRCAQTERKEVNTRKKVMSRLFLTLFSTVRSVLASRNLMDRDVSGLFGVLLPANVIALLLPVYISWNISADHMNSMVTLSITTTLMVDGRFSVPTALLYWIHQMVALFMVCLAIKVIVVEQYIPLYRFAGEPTGFGASDFEGGLAFVLVCIVCMAALNTLELWLQNGPMRFLAHWLGIYGYKETKETLVENEQHCIRRLKSHGLEPLQTTYNKFSDYSDAKSI